MGSNRHDISVCLCAQNIGDTKQNLENTQSKHVTSPFTNQSLNPDVKRNLSEVPREMAGQLSAISEASPPWNICGSWKMLLLLYNFKSPLEYSDGCILLMFSTIHNRVKEYEAILTYF